MPFSFWLTPRESNMYHLFQLNADKSPFQRVYAAQVLDLFQCFLAAVHVMLYGHISVQLITRSSFFNPRKGAESRNILQSAYVID